MFMSWTRHSNPKYKFLWNKVILMRDLLSKLQDNCIFIKANYVSTHSLISMLTVLPFQGMTKGVPIENNIYDCFWSMEIFYQLGYTRYCTFNSMIKSYMYCRFTWYGGRGGQLMRPLILNT